MAGEKEKRIMEYFEKKKTMEEKEKFFMEQMEEASNLVADNKFDEGVNIFMSLIPVAEELNWPTKISMIKDLVYEARENQKEQEAREKHMQSVKEKKELEQSTYNDALDLMGNAADEFKKENWDEAIKLYNQSLEFLRKIDARREINIVEESIQKIKAKREQIEKLRAQTKPVKPEPASATATPVVKKSPPIESEAMTRVRLLQEKKEREQAIVDEAMDLLDKANLELKKASSFDFVSVDAKKDRYEEVIACYQDAAAKFVEVGWNDEAGKVRDNILKIKRERDEGLEILEKKLAAMKDKVATAQEPITGISPKITVKRDKEAEATIQKKLDQQEKREAAFSALDAAGNALQEFEKKPKIIGGQLFKENEYPEIINMYLQALNLFKEINWINEAAKIEESIEILRRQEKDFIAEKENFDRKQASLAGTEVLKDKVLAARRTKELSKYKRDNLLQGQIEARQKEKEEIRKKIDGMLDIAMNFFKKDELQKAEAAYLEAHELMLEHEWTQEATMVMDTIKMIREKREKRDRLLVTKERAVGEAGQFTKGVEQISATMDVIQSQESQQSEVDRKKLLEKKEEQKKKEEVYFIILGKAQDAINSRDYATAIDFYKEALVLAEDLNWLSQIRDLNDFIADAKKKEQLDAERQKKQQESVQEREVMAARAREEGVDQAPDTEVKAKEREPVITQRQKERQIGDKAFSLLDDANSLLKEEKREDAIKVFKEAMVLFESISWTRERDAVIQQIRNIEMEIEKEQVLASKEKEAEKVKYAYAAIDDAEKCLRNRLPEEALVCYDRALETFEAIEWTKEAGMVRAQIEKVKEDMAKRLVAEDRGTEKERVDQAFALIDEAKKYQRNRKIFKAVEIAHEALEIFNTLGDSWSRETAQIKKFVDDLEEEKKRKEELIKKLTSGEL